LASRSTLALQLTEAEEKERRRISDLRHEDVQQLLSASRFQLSAIRRAVEGYANVGLRLQQVDRLLEESIEKARRLSHDLSPAILHQAGLLAGVEWLARRMKENHGLEVYVNGTLFQPLSSEALNTLLYRAIQELLLNVSKHAGVREARVELRSAADHAEVVVSDQGKGFDPQSIGVTLHGKGFGLFGLRERLNYLGGSFSIESASGEGCRIALSVPLKELQETEKADEPPADPGAPDARN
jgi:signal transduction histidine kinase